MYLPVCFARLLPFMFLGAHIAFPAVIVILDHEGTYQFLSADFLQVNAKDRIRVCQPGPTFTAKQLSQCSSQKLAQIEILHQDFVRGALVAPSPGGTLFALPEGSKEGGSPKALWQQAQLSVSTGGAKQATALPNGEIIAILSATNPDRLLADYLSEEANFTLAAGRNATLQLQGRLIAAATKAMPQSEAIKSIRARAEIALKKNVDRVNSGLVELQDLEEVRKRVELSRLLYPADPPQILIRDRFAALELKLRQTQSILKALAIGGQWDAYLALYRGFQQYEFLFPDMQDTFRKALESSRDQHKLLAQSRFALKDCGGALSHLRIGLKRDPSDLLAREQSETARVCLVRAPRAAKRSTGLGVEAEMAPALRTNDFVSRFIQEAKLDSAEKSLTDGLKLYPDFPPLRLSEARLLEKRSKLREALSVLDKYDSLVFSQTQWDEGDKARRDIEFQMLKGRDERMSRLTALLKSNRFGSAMALVKEGLASDSEDQDLLFRAAILSLMLRQPVESKAFLTRYLEASQSLSGSPTRRRQAFSILSGLEQPKIDQPQVGASHWLSHSLLPDNILYDPASLGFNRHIARVNGSQKQFTEFQWKGDRLEAIQVYAEEKPPRMILKTRFGYDPATGAVIRVFDATKEDATAKPADPVLAQPQVNNIFSDEPTAASAKSVLPSGRQATDVGNPLSGQGFPVLLSTNPRLDLPIIEKLTGVQLGYTVAGNRYFHPFVWEKPTVFRVSYDESGRVKYAFPEASGKTPAEIYEFVWAGQQLQQISLYPQLADASADKSKILYRRSLTYSDGKLVNEKIIGPSAKPASIEYKYQGQQLISAECSEDSTIDGRSRKVIFAVH